MEKAKTTVGIIGAGMSGISAAVYIQKKFGHDNVDIVIFEKNTEVGGTWAGHSSADYPNAACDVQSIWYSFSFAPYARWSHSYSYRAEIQKYLDKVVKDHSLQPLVRLNTIVTSAEWKSDTARWCITYTDRLTGEVHQKYVQFLIAAPGALSEPKFPDIPHRESFQGPFWHSARWNPENVNYENLRVGVIGTGASSIQIVPGIADKVKHLTVFQRTPPWVVPRHSITFTEKDHSWFEKYPLLFWFYRLWIALEMDLRFWVLILPIANYLNNIAVTVAKKHMYKGVSYLSAPFICFSIVSFYLCTVTYLCHLLTSSFYSSAQTRNKPELRESLIPKYPIACKRILVSDDYFPALARENVSLECSSIQRITPKGVLVSGPSLSSAVTVPDEEQEVREIPLDVIIYATGFDVIASFSTTRIVGMDNRILQEEWTQIDGPEAYMGTFVSGYPNL